MNGKDQLNASAKGSNRSLLLEALCLLSFAGSSIGMLLYLAAALFFEETEKIITRFSGFDQTGLLSPLYFVLMGGFHLLSLTGVYRMWQFRKSGLFIYALAQLSIFFLPLLWIGKEAFSSVALIFTLLFLSGYALCFRHFRDHSLENSRTLSR